MTTKVFYAGRPPGSFAFVASIFTNPDGSIGSNAPLTQPFSNLDRVCYDSRFSYFNITQTFTFIKPFGAVNTNTSDITKKGKTGANVPIERNFTTALFFHQLPYIPAGLLIDNDTKEVIGGQQLLQVEGNNSFRAISLIADNQFFYIKEKVFVYKNSLPALTKTYTLLVFDKEASVPEF